MTLIEYVQDLGSNPYFGAGFGLVGIGAGAAVLKKAFMGAALLFRRHCLTSIEVTCKDKSYQWLLQWITEKGAKNTQHLNVETTFVMNDTGLIKTAYHFTPSRGTHFCSYEGNFIKITRKREQAMDLTLGVPMEMVTLTAFGRDKTMYYRLLEEARNLALKKHENKTVMYTAYGSEWREFGHPRKRRPLSSVVLDMGVKERILQDCKEFLDNAEWYSERGIPYRRGYLLYGPPGCGKSSFISALAGELHYGICVLNLSDRFLSDTKLNHLLAMAPQSSIILLEDIDSAFVSRDETPNGKNTYEGLNELTFSGLLNSLDGVASSEARILFMTTNHIDRLDPALIRPGRVDVKEYVGLCTPYQIEKMFRRFFPELADQSQKFTDTVMSCKRSVSPAQLQGYFMYYKENANDALRDVHKIWELN